MFKKKHLRIVAEIEASHARRLTKDAAWIDQLETEIHALGRGLYDDRFKDANDDAWYLGCLRDARLVIPKRFTEMELETLRAEGGK